jgi:hypothetical protein
MTRHKFIHCRNKHEGVAMPELPGQFFTGESLATLTGATGATWAVTGAAHNAFGWSPAWFGLLAAECVCLLAVYYADKFKTAWWIAVLNGCLVYLAAAGFTGGASTAATKLAEIGNPLSKTLAVVPGFIESWF